MPDVGGVMSPDRKLLSPPDWDSTGPAREVRDEIDEDAALDGVAVELPAGPPLLETEAGAGDDSRAPDRLLKVLPALESRALRQLPQAAARGPTA